MSVDLSVFDPLTSVLAPCFCKCPLMAQSRNLLQLIMSAFGGKADIPDSVSNVR